MLLIITEWPAFAALTPAQLAGQMRGRLVLDYRQIWQGQDWRAAGFTYHRLGTRTTAAPS